MDAFHRREQKPGEVVRLPEYSRAKIRSLHSLLSSTLPPSPQAISPPPLPEFTLECLESKAVMFSGDHLCRSLELTKPVCESLRLCVKIVKGN